MMGIAVAYSGVHQAFQLALAAHEIDELDRFYCSFFAGNGTCGRVLQRAFGSERLVSWQAPAISRAKIAENPWPWLFRRCHSRLLRPAGSDWLVANTWFDRWVSRQLGKSASRVFVGVETCAADSFEAARERGMIRALDCPGIQTEFLDDYARRTAAEFGLVDVSSSDSAGMLARKAKELKLADAILVSSCQQAKLLGDRVTPRLGFHVIPLWVDSSFWRPPEIPKRPEVAPLRVLFAGKVSLRKGVPYLMRAAASLRGEVSVTFVGELNDELEPLLRDKPPNTRFLPAVSKLELLRHYREHDVLVLPSLGDAFGFVALEAMSCGLPVVVTENCGVPVPDASWRVAVMSSAAIAERLMIYAADRERCRADGALAREFARRYTPERYRESIKRVFRQILEPDVAVAESRANKPIHHELVDEPTLACRT